MRRWQDIYSLDLEIFTVYPSSNLGCKMRSALIISDVLSPLRRFDPLLCWLLAGIKCKDEKHVMIILLARPAPDLAPHHTAR